MKQYLLFLSVLSTASLAFSSPISISIYSGTLTMPGGFQPQGPLVSFNLATSTGSLTGASRAGTSYQIGDWPATLPASITPSVFFGSLDASMVIVHNGVSYAFEPRLNSITPDEMLPGSITFPASLVISSLGPTVLEMPFVAFFELAENFQLNGATQQIFQYSGTGVATFRFHAFQNVSYPAGPPTVVFDGATFQFVPEPPAGLEMLLGATLLASAYLVKRRLHLGTSAKRRP